MIKARHKSNFSEFRIFQRAAALLAGLVISGSALAQGSYCPSAATSTADEDIYSVTLGTWTNSSTCATIAPGTGSIQNRYSNYAGSVLPPDVTAGSTLPLTLNVGTCGGNYGNMSAVFIDYNRDGTYNLATERVYVSPASVTGPHIETGTINVPASISFGQTGMRVMVIEFATAADLIPCASYSWGETEDYIVNLIPAGPPTCITAPLSPANGSTTACAGGTLLSWNTKPGAIGYDVFLDPGTAPATTRIGNNIPDTFINVTSTVPAGPFSWRIVPRNFSGSATGCSNFTFTSANGAIAGATISAGPDTVICPYQSTTFTAVPISGGSAPGYQWQKNGLNVGTNSSTYTDANLNNNDKVKVIVTTSLTTGCITSRTGPSREITINWKPVPPSTITATGDTGFCAGGSVVLSVPAGAVSYQWQLNGVNIATNSTSPTYTGIYTGSYVAVITGSNGCYIRSLPKQVTAFSPSVAELTRTGNTIATKINYPSYQWYKNDVILPGETNATYTFTTDGRYHVVVQDTNGCGGRSSYLYVNELAVGATPANSDFNIYPNPATRIVKSNTAAALNISVRSMDGKEMLTFRGVKEFDISNLPSGMYLLYLADSKNQFIKVQKLIKTEF